LEKDLLKKENIQRLNEENVAKSIKLREGKDLWFRTSGSL